MLMRQKQSRLLVSILSSGNLPGLSSPEKAAEEEAVLDRGYQYFPE